MRLLALFLLAPLACSSSEMSDDAAVVARQQSPDSIRVVNATASPIYVIHMPERAARPLRQEVTLDLTEPPAAYLEPDSAMVLPQITCTERNRLQGDQLLLYRVGPPEANGRATATLVATRPFTAEVLTALAANDCRLIVEALDDA
jgi:hypothetical protein